MGWDFDNSKPIYIQIADKIQSMIFSEKYKEGERIPSVRDLAMEAAVNPNTMQRALQELENRSLVTVQRASGRQVTSDRQAIEKARNEKAEEISKAYINEMQTLGFSKSEFKEIIEKIWNR